ncbi:MAG: flagellar biosynthetic protein FliO [Deltaproteobacteria bacterium]
MRQPARALLALWVCLLASGSALALDPAGGPAVPPGMDPRDFVSAADLPDASVEEPAWLGQSSREAAPAFAPSSSSHSPVLSVLALLLVLGLGGGALWLQRRKAKASPLGALESRLTLLSSTRVGPKAFAVSAEVNGRVLLLGVTDHQVTNLGWLDPPELEASDLAEAPEPEAAVPETDELPDDYPGSALRAAALQASLHPSSTVHQPSLTSSHNLRRFQEVLRGALPSQAPSVRAPRRPAPAREFLGRSGPPPGSDAASTLAALTSDVIGSAVAPAGRSVAPASLRRKRQRRQEANTKPKASVLPDADADAVAANNPIEGQVAGLRALKNG